MRIENYFRALTSDIQLGNMQFFFVTETKTKT